MQDMAMNLMVAALLTPVAREYLTNRTLLEPQLDQSKLANSKLANSVLESCLMSSFRDNCKIVQVCKIFHRFNTTLYSLPRLAQ